MNDTDDAPLTAREQRMMAYVDDELSAADRTAFERELNQDAELAAEIADYRQLLDISRSMPLLEPTDHELRRFWARFYNRAEWRLGWIMLGAGVVALVGYGLVELFASDFPWIVKASLISIVAGASILLVNTIRQRVRAHRLDRYRGVLR